MATDKKLCINRSAAKLYARGRPLGSYWTPDRNAAVVKIMESEYQAKVTSLDPNFAGFAQTSSWVAERVKQILSPEGDNIFGNIPDEDYKGLAKQTKDKFSNFYSKLKKKAGKTKANSTSPTGVQSSSRITTPPSTNTPTPLDKRFQNLFFAPLTGRDLFESERKADIIASLGGSSGPNYQTVLKEKWAAVGSDARSEWERRAAEIGEDVESNVLVFENNMEQVLASLCQSGRLGNTQMLLFFANRFTNNDLRVRTFSSRSHGLEDFASSSKGEESMNLFIEDWVDFMSFDIPPIAKPSDNIHIPTDEGGVPVFPEVDIGVTTPVAMRDILTKYLQTIWDYCRAPQALDESMWDEIAASPCDFYDSLKFRIDLSDPLRMNDIEVMQCMFYFRQQVPECGEPFVFISPEDGSSHGHRRTITGVHHNSVERHGGVGGSGSVGDDGDGVIASAGSNNGDRSSLTGGGGLENDCYGNSSGIGDEPSSKNDDAEEEASAPIRNFGRIRKLGRTRKAKGDHDDDDDDNNNDSGDAEEPSAPPQKLERKRQAAESLSSKSKKRKVDSAVINSDKPHSTRTTRSSGRLPQDSSSKKAPPKAPAPAEKMPRGRKLVSGLYTFNTTVSGFRTTHYKYEGEELPAWKIAMKNPAWLAKAWPKSVTSIATP